MNKETWDANFYGGIYSNLTLISFWDLTNIAAKKTPKVKFINTVLLPLLLINFTKNGNSGFLLVFFYLVMQIST